MTGWRPADLLARNASGTFHPLACVLPGGCSHIECAVLRTSHTLCGSYRKTRWKLVVDLSGLSIDTFTQRMYNLSSRGNGRGEANTLEGAAMTSETKDIAWGRIIAPLPKREGHIDGCLCKDCTPSYAHSVRCRCLTGIHAHGDKVRV